MASINSLPLEVIDIVIRRIATSVDEANFQNQLALTARISSSWTTFSQEVLHSNIRLGNQEQARAWLESGKAGEFKTRVLQLKGNINSETSREVMEKMNGLKEVTVELDKEKEFDMNILQHERFSELHSLTISSHVSFNETEIGFPFQLITLHCNSDSNPSLSLVTALLSASPSLEVLNLVPSSQLDFTPVLNEANLPQLIGLVLYCKQIFKVYQFPSLKHLFFHCSTEFLGIDYFLKVQVNLGLLRSGQLSSLILMLSPYQDLTEALENIDTMMKEISGLKDLKLLSLGYHGEESDRSKELVLEWKKRGIETHFRKMGPMPVRRP